MLFKQHYFTLRQHILPPLGPRAYSWFQGISLLAFFLTFFVTPANIPHNYKVTAAPQKSQQLPTSEKRRPLNPLQKEAFIKSTPDSCEPLVFSIMMQTIVIVGKLLSPRAHGILGLS